MKILGIIVLLAWAVGTCLCWAAFMQYITLGDKRGARNLLIVSGVVVNHNSNVISFGMVNHCKRRHKRP